MALTCTRQIYTMLYITYTSTFSKVPHLPKIENQESLGTELTSKHLSLERSSHLDFCWWREDASPYIFLVNKQE